MQCKDDLICNEFDFRNIRIGDAVKQFFNLAAGRFLEGSGLDCVPASGLWEKINVAR